MTGNAPERRLPGREDLPVQAGAVHLVGIGGAGMGGLAVALAEEGFRVSGCDQGGAPDAPELRARGVELAGEHDRRHADGTDLLVHSSAVPEDHPELAEARGRGIPVLKRARAMGALVNGRALVAVSGTHGKTSTTALAGHALVESGRDPLVLVGGRVPGWDGYARAGDGEEAVAEADEYDRSFLQLDPALTVITSVEPEHMDTYGDVSALIRAFRELAARSADRRGVLYCADDEGARRTAAPVQDRWSYGLSAEADYRVRATGREAAGGQRLQLDAPEGRVRTLLPLSGEHDARNAAAALAAALRMGVEPGALDGALASFPGVERRLEVITERADLAVIDDYAHHPTEVSASLGAAGRRYPDRRLVAVFQPHLFTRTRDFADRFAEALADADRAYVLPIYPSREDPIPGVTSDLIVDAGPAAVEGARPEEVTDPGWIGEVASRPSVLLYMGAGDVTELAREAARRASGAGEPEEVGG